MCDLFDDLDDATRTTLIAYNYWLSDKQARCWRNSQTARRCKCQRNHSTPIYQSTWDTHLSHGQWKLEPKSIGWISECY